jgi:hypothetical protein
VSNNNWIEITLIAGRLEFISLLNAFSKETWPQKADELLDKIFSEIYPNSILMKSRPLIEDCDLTISFEDICSEFEDCFHNFFEHMIIDEISQITYLLEEIHFIITKFHSYTSNFVSRMFRIFIFLNAFRSVSSLSNLQIGSGQILIQKRISQESFSEFPLTNDNIYF